MKILYYDIFSGISGDMNAGALLDLGVPFEYLKSELSKLNLEGYEIKMEKAMKMGISGTKFHVEQCEQHHHRHYSHIRDMILKSSLKDEVKKMSIDIFYNIAEAEGKVHGKPVEDVHFHEVGAIDSIIDIVSAAICICYLKPDKIISSTIEVGKGFIKCAHGTYPVPAPATSYLLQGLKIKSLNVPFEATTPTGAGIIKTVADAFSDDMDFKIIKTAYGVGNKDGNIPNVLRVFLGEKEEDENSAYVVECDIDDMSPEGVEVVINKLFDIPVYDANVTQIIMKKGRPAIKLTVVSSYELLEEVKKIIFKNTTTIGLRYYKVQRERLKREIYNVITSYGNVKVKSSYYNGEEVNLKPEYEDLKRAAEKYDVSINRVFNEVIYENRKEKDKIE